QTIDVGFRLGNRGDKPLAFNLFETLRPALKSADGKTVERGEVRKRTAPPPPVVVGPGKTETIVRQARLVWTGPGKTMSSIIPGVSDGAWQFGGLVPGKYLLSFEYDNSEELLAQFLRHRPTVLEEGQSFWTGKVVTNDVEFEI